MLTIGISGTRASFSEQAAEEYAREEELRELDIDYLVSVECVLSALDKGRIDLGIFPIYNSTGGVVTETLYAMAGHIFSIKKIFDIDVRHFLMAFEGTKKEDIKTIVSHDQALAQCRTYLKTRWPDVELKEYQDTAKAAQDLRAGILPADTAVIASRVAADLYDLEILEENIQDLQINLTTFVVVVRKDA